MHDVGFDNSEWYLALGLKERARCTAENRPAPVSASVRTRFERWKSQRPFADGDWLSLRLAADGLDLAALENTLALSAADLKARASRPHWLSQIEEAFVRDGGTTNNTVFLDEDDATADLLNLVGPMLESARRRLRAALSPLAGRPPIDVDTTIDKLVSIIARRALYTIERALVLELHIAKLEGRLEGATPEARFEHFARSLAARERAATVLSTYPVLARRVVENIDDAVAASVEFAQRLVEDWTAIRTEFFAGGDPGRLVDLDAQVGDPHRRGRRVVIATFESGPRLVYKPRPLGVDMHFQQFLAFINERVEGPKLRTISVVARPGYGWLEFIDAKPCHSRDEAHRYYWRLGGLLAALHALRGVDCHYENLIAHGDQPVLVDMETIMHPAISYREPDRYDRRFASRLLTRSVLRVGLLPVPTGGADPAGGIDLSGVGSVEGKMSPDRVLQWDRRGTDEMRAVRETVAMQGADNRPHLDGRPLDVKEFRDDIAGGFAAVYRLIVKERDVLLARGGPVEAFAADTVRVVLRATRAYGLLLTESLHPDLLRDALDRDRFFDRLWVGVEERPAIARAVHAEHRDLSHADIPYFTCRPDARDLWTSDGECIPDFFDRPAIDLVRERIRAMDEDDLARQQWMVSLSLGSLVHYRDETVARPPAKPAVEVDHAALRRSMVAEALRIGDRLGEIAEWDGDDVAWTALDFREQRWFLAPVSTDFYVGLPGVALFLGYLARIARDMHLPGTDKRARLAQSAARTLLRVTAELETESVGALAGWGGVLYACTHLAALGQGVELNAACARIVQRIDALADRDEDIDVVSGLAGTIGTLCAAHAARTSEKALAVAVRCGDLLLARAVREQSGLWWRTRLNHLPQTGFSHGNSGIAWALLTLGDVAGDERFRRAAYEALAMEREVLRAAHDRAGESSPDVRPSVGAGSITASWCYGTPGLGLARLCALQSAERAGGSEADRRLLRAEIEQLVLSTFERGFVDNHCLCHGDLGTLDFLIQARAVIPGFEARIAAAAAYVLDDIVRNGARCGTPEHVPSPGIMNGLSGIGYGLLRLADSDRVPSLLTLEPPRAYRRAPAK